MAVLTRYSEAFWSTDFNSTSGTEALSRRNAEQKKFLHDIEDYMRKRSKIESEYGKSLGQLWKSLKDRVPVGQLERGWNTLRTELETCRQAHENTANFLWQHSEDVKRLCRELTARRDAIEEKVRKIQTQKFSQYKTVTSLQKSYIQKCRETEQARDGYTVLKGVVTSSIKDQDKAKAKLERCEDEGNKADVAYRNAVLTLEDIRSSWERAMEIACQEFQQRDEEQIEFLRSEMWFTVNVLSQAALCTDQGCERVRQVLEKCEIDLEIQGFLRVSSTGSERAPPVVYQNYFDNTTTTTTNNTTITTTLGQGKHSRAE